MPSEQSSPIQVTTLPSGLRVVTETMPHLATAALGVWVDAGARAEYENEHGIAHLLEHMAFKGTARRTAMDIALEIESVGGDLNAATSIETTSYYARVLKEDVPLAIDILADIMQNATFDAEELEREQNVIVQEIKAAEDTPDDVVFDLAQAIAFQDQNLGRSILGTEHTVCNFKADSLHAYLGRHYGPGRMILAAAGAVDHAQVVELASRAFAGLSPAKEVPSGLASFTGGVSVAEKPIEQAHVVLNFEGVSYHEPDFYAAQVFATLLGGGMSSRLFQEVREKRGLCYGIYSYHWSVSDTGLFGIYAATAPDAVPELVGTVSDVLRTVADDDLSDELKKAKTQLKAGLLMSLERPSSRISQMAQQIAVFDRVLSADELIQAVEQVSIDDMARLGKKWATAPIAAGLVGPESGIVQGSAALASHFKLNEAA